jgi:hypothetical protein
MTLIALQRIIKAYDEFVSDVLFWFLLLDTNSCVVDLFMGGKEYSSRRFHRGYISLPPWTFLGFNQMVEHTSTLLASEDIHTRALSIKYLKTHGRPVSIPYLLCHI